MSDLTRRSTESNTSAELTVADVGIGETVFVQAAGEPARGAADADQEQQAQLMLAYGIRHDGRRYCFGNYCSIRLQDAIACARLAARRALYISGGNRVTRGARNGDVTPPSD